MLEAGAWLGAPHPRAPRPGASSSLSPEVWGRGGDLLSAIGAARGWLRRRGGFCAERVACAFVRRAQCLAAERRRRCAAALVYGGTEMINAGIIPARPPAPVCSLRFGRPATHGGTGELRCGRGRPRAAPRPASGVGVPSPPVLAPGCHRRPRHSPASGSPCSPPRLLEGCGAAAS